MQGAPLVAEIRVVLENLVGKAIEAKVEAALAMVVHIRRAL